MLKLLSITQHRVDIAHHGNHSLSLTSALLTVVDQKQRVDHLVNMSAILRQVELASGKVIILSHCLAISLGLRLENILFEPLTYSVRFNIPGAYCTER